MQRGTTYVWQVTALRNGIEVTSPEPPAGEARFQILDQQTQDQLEQERQRYSSSNLLLGLLYARHGLLDEAEQNFQQLADTNPESREIKELLENPQKASNASEAIDECSLVAITIPTEQKNVRAILREATDETNITHSNRPGGRYCHRVIHISHKKPLTAYTHPCN